MGKDRQKFGFNATWSMAVGGMVGGGIFSVLGVVVYKAGKWAWLSLLMAGLIALISAISYSQLSLKYRQSGGAFTFLNKMSYHGAAASLSWVLILGYILTLSVYAFTFGHYVAHVFQWGSWLPRALAFVVIALFTIVNLRGAGDSSRVEIITVWGKVFVLLGLALFGIIQWNPGELSAGIDSKSWSSAILGAASIFMAYEGFQLLSYDYGDIRYVSKNLPRATITAVISVIAIYILVAYGATMLVGANTLIEKEEVALAVAGEKALGQAGLIIVTIAAAFSTGSAINATLFSTGRLMESVAEKKDLPSELARENKSNMPLYSIITISALAAILSILGSLGTLVDAASLIFLITFGVVNYIAFYEKVEYRWISMIGAIASLAAVVLSITEQIRNKPIPLMIMLVFIGGSFILRPFILRKLKNHK